MRRTSSFALIAMTLANSAISSTSFSMKETAPAPAKMRKIVSEAEMVEKIMKMQREKLKQQGAMDIPKPVKIKSKALERYGGAGSVSETAKVIHFQRHGEGYHNLLGKTWRELGRGVDISSNDPARNPFVRPEILDAPLTALGRAEAIEKQALAGQMSPELVVVSPLYRAIETAYYTFADHRHVPWIAHDGCREDLGLLICNKRRPLSQTSADFPHVDFSLITSEEDSLFVHDEEECTAEQAKRAYSFLVDFVRKRPEREIAIVGHSAWLFNVFNAVMDCGENRDLMSWFATSEIRSLEVEFLGK